MKIELIGLENLPLIKKDDELSSLILESAIVQGLKWKNGDIIVIAETIISKAEGNYINLDSIKPGAEANDLAQKTGKSPELMEAILNHSREIVKVGNDFIVTESNHGFICANAGIDESNVENGWATPLPHNPDNSAKKLRKNIELKTGKKIAVVISDTQGRPFREGAVGVAIGSSGIKAIWNRKGEMDLYGRKLETTRIAVADELAASSSLIMGQADEGLPVVIVRGYPNFEILKDPEAGARDLIRPKKHDAFRA